MPWHIIIPIIVTLIFDALVIVLFRLGMYWGMRSQDTLFVRRVAKGWVRGWLFVIALMIPWLMLLVVFLIAFDYSGSPEYAHSMFFGSIVVVLSYPGVDIESRVRTAHPTIERKPAIIAALGWTVPFAIFWAAGFWIYSTQYHEINKLARVLVPRQ